MLIAGIFIGVVSTVVIAVFYYVFTPLPFNWRRFLARYGIYQAFNFIGHLTFKQARTKRGYKRLADAGYLTHWQARVLMTIKAGDR